MNGASRAGRALLAGFAVFALSCGQDQLHFEVDRDASVCSGESKSAQAALGFGADNLSPAQIRALADSIERQLTESAGATDSGAGLADGQSDLDSAPGQRSDSPDSFGTTLPSTSANDDGPEGHPTGPAEWPSWCGHGVVQTELCGTGLDEDCDGSVDELAGIGDPCQPTDVRQGCAQRADLVCVPGTASLRCMAEGCTGDGASLSVGCGNGLVDATEECDPAALGQTVNQTCTRDCRLPLFRQCVVAGHADDHACDRDHVCSHWVGACMPTVSDGRRCPELVVEHDPLEATGAVYPMVETEDKQCWVTCMSSATCPSSLAHCYLLASAWKR